MVRFLACLFLWLASAVQGPGQELTGKAKLESILAQVSAAQAHVRTISAHFRQTKTSHLLKDPLVSQGQFFYAAPDHVRWDYQVPNAFVVLIAGKSMVTYRPAEKLAEKVELGRAQRKVFTFLSASEPVASLTRHFTLTLQDPGGQENFVLILQPVTHHIKKRLKQVELVIDRKSFLPVKVAYTEADGDVTTYEFSQIEINRELPPSLFSLDLPAGVRVVELKLRGAQ